MQLSKALAPLFAASTAAASLPFGSNQLPFGEPARDVSSLDLSVPGENPLNFCEDPKDYIATVTNVDLDPNPPKAGEALKIVANVTVSETIKKGAYVTISVKYGLIKILTLTEDLCDQLKNVDKECPVEKGDISAVKEVNLPGRIPPGLYTVHADAYTVDDERLTCLEASIHFGS